MINPLSFLNKVKTLYIEVLETRIIFKLKKRKFMPFEALKINGILSKKIKTKVVYL